MKNILFVAFVLAFILVPTLVFCSESECNKYCLIAFKDINNINACNVGCSYGMKQFSACKNTELTSQLNKTKPKGSAKTPIGVEEKAAAKEALQALEALQSVVNSGVSYRDYGTRKLDTRIIIDRFLNEYKQNPAADAIKEAMTHYENAENIWQDYFSGTDNSNDFLPYSDVAIYEQFYPELKEQVKIIVDLHMIYLPTALSIIWNKASEAIDKTRSILKQ
jgi:hypothetical protein